MDNGDKNKKRGREGRERRRGDRGRLRDGPARPASEAPRRRRPRSRRHRRSRSSRPIQPLVRVDLYTSAPHQVNGLNGRDPSPELEELREQLAAAQKREVELRAAFAEQVEAYERKLSRGVRRLARADEAPRAQRASFRRPKRRSGSASSGSPKSARSSTPSASGSQRSRTRLQQPSLLPPSSRRSSRHATPS